MFFYYAQSIYSSYKNGVKLHRVRKKRGYVIFNYNSRIHWSIFIIFIQLETGMYTPQLHVIYLLKIFMTS